MEGTESYPIALWRTSRALVFRDQVKEDHQSCRQMLESRKIRHAISSDLCIIPLIRMGLLIPDCILFDCLTGAHCAVEKSPFVIGSGPDCDWRIDDPDVPETHSVIQCKRRR